MNIKIGRDFCHSELMGNNVKQSIALDRGETTPKKLILLSFMLNIIQVFGKLAYLSLLSGRRTLSRQFSFGSGLFRSLFEMISNFLGNLGIRIQLAMT